MDPPLKTIVKSTGLCIIILGVIHTGWYYLRQKYVPKEEQMYTPIVAMAEHLLGLDKEKTSNDKKTS